MATNVPFCRPLIVGTRGNDVIAHKRALSRADPDLYPWLGTKFTPIFGHRFEKAVVGYQKRNGIRPASGKIGKGTHEALEKDKNKQGKPAFDAYSVQLAKSFCEEHTRSTREEIVDAAFFWYKHRSQIHYSQARPYQIGVPLWVPDMWDCSSFVTVCYYAGGADDPNGRGYDRYGYTGTLMSHGEKITKTMLRPGDLIFYGYTRVARPGFPVGSPTHVSLYVGDDMVLSMGSYPMGYYRYTYRSDLHHFRSYGIA